MDQEAILESSAAPLLNQLLTAVSDDERFSIVSAFEALALDARAAMEPIVAGFLQDKNLPDVTRSWMPTLLGRIGTPSGKSLLMSQLPTEQTDVVRRSIVRTLVRNYCGDDCIRLIIDQFRREQTFHNRWYLCKALGESRNRLAVPLLIELLEEENEAMRATAATGLGLIRLAKATVSLVDRLGVDRSVSVRRAIVDALGAIADRRALDGLFRILLKVGEPADLVIAATQAVAKIANPPDDDVLRIVLRLVCHAEPIVAVSAVVEGLLRLVPPEKASDLLIEFGLRDAPAESLSKVADGLRLIGHPSAVQKLREAAVHGPSTGRANTLLEFVGGRQALEFLLNERADVLMQTRTRVQQFDQQALKIFDDTVTQAKRGFAVSMTMSVAIFIVGLIVLVYGLYVLAISKQPVLGATSTLAGVGTILAMFYSGPLKSTQDAVMNLVETEIVFLGYIRQITQITAMFEREYLDNDRFSVGDLGKLLNFTQDVMIRTLALVSRSMPLPSPKLGAVHEDRIGD